MMFSWDAVVGPAGPTSRALRTPKAMRLWVCTDSRQILVQGIYFNSIQYSTWSVANVQDYPADSNPTPSLNNIWAGRGPPTSGTLWLWGFWTYIYSVAFRLLHFVWIFNPLPANHSQFKIANFKAQVMLFMLPRKSKQKHKTQQIQKFQHKKQPIKTLTQRFSAISTPTKTTAFIYANMRDLSAIRRLPSHKCEKC
jgi:hypothetical protein